jgi:hypothetical protein
VNEGVFLPGSAGLMLADNVVPLDPQPAVLQAMLDGWVRQQHARFLKDDTITDRVRMVKRLVEFSNLYPWEWTAGELEAFAADLRGGARPVRESTARGFVRWGKSSRGSPPKRRTVLTVPEMDWIVPVLEQWVDEVRELFNPGRHPALWVTERRGRLSCRGVDEAFEAARVEADLPDELDLHCLRHSYVTHLMEFDYPERFVQDQVGHAYASTTAIYSGVSDEYRNRLLTRALKARELDLWEASS